MRSEEFFFSEFYYPKEIVTENEADVQVLSISRTLLGLYCKIPD